VFPRVVDGLPPAVHADVVSGSLLEYWRARATQHTTDSYAGVPMAKFPEDLRVYEHLLWLQVPDVVLEIGTQSGGSALWFRDRLRTLETHGRLSRPGRVVSLDIDQSLAQKQLAGRDDGITLIEGDVRDDAAVEAVHRAVAGVTNCMVIEDSAHVYETTMAAMEAFSRLVPVHGFMVIEDGCVDVPEMRIRDDWPRGVLRALTDWLARPQAGGFVVRRDLELYGLSCHPGGFLQRES
jgi:cephalosporin hydroxylase